MEEKLTYAPEETFALAKALGEQCRPGEVYCLNGDLGAGKTLFAQGFGAGLGITDPINSPTFTIVQIYDEGRMPLYHFDVYRIADPEEMYEVGFDEYIEGQGVCLIEWSDLIEDILPPHRIDIRIERVPGGGDEERRLRICRF